MKAVFIKEFGSTENLEICETKNPPAPKNKEVVVNVKTSALNRADILQRKGFYPAPKDFSSKIPGLEFAGVVSTIGSEVKNLKTGDRVFGITAGGAQAEFVLTDEALLAKIPDNLNFIEAAAIPEAFITAHDAIFAQGKLQTNETLLIHAVGSGVGLAALQLAKAKAIKTFGTSRTQNKLDKCSKFGLDEAIVMENAENFAEKIMEKTGNNGVDVILDLVGGSYFPSNLKSLALKGRIVLVGLTGGAKAELDLAMALSKRAKIIGTVLRSRSAEEKADATTRFIEEVLPLLENGVIKPNVDKVFSVEEIRKAHAYMESNESFGKIILEF